MYETILFPYDGSDGADEVLQHACDIADWADATLQLLFVADTTQDSVTRIGSEVVDALVRQGETVLDDAVANLPQSRIDYERDVVQGNPAPTIVEYAQRYGADVIVMPTEGHQGVTRYLLGSVSEKVLRLSSLPVLVARMRPDEHLTFPYEDILIPTDGSEPATHAATHGLSLTAALDATVHVLSVVEEAGLGVDVRSTFTEADEQQTAETAVEEVVTTAEEHGISTPLTQITRGSPSEEILDYVQAHEIDAVVMGTTGRRRTERILLGSVAEKTVRTVPVPVVTVPGQHDTDQQ